MAFLRIFEKMMRAEKAATVIRVNRPVNKSQTYGIISGIITEYDIMILTYDWKQIAQHRTSREEFPPRTT